MMKKEYIFELYNAVFYVNERPQVCGDFQKSNEIENSENLVITISIHANDPIIAASRKWFLVQHKTTPFENPALLQQGGVIFSHLIPPP